MHTPPFPIIRNLERLSERRRPACQTSKGEVAREMTANKQAPKCNDAAVRTGQFIDEGSIERLRKMSDGELAWFQNSVMGFIETMDVDGALVDANARKEAVALLNRVLAESRQRKGAVAASPVNNVCHDPAPP